MASAPLVPDGPAVAAAFGLGRVLDGPTFAARGELGLVYRLATSSGTWAVKHLLVVPDEAEADDNLRYQEAVLAAGVPLPRPRRALDGRVVVGAERVYEWVDLRPGETVDAATAGALLARIHAVRWPAGGEPDAWYHAAVEPARWAQLAAQGAAADAPWAAPLARAVPELVAGASLLVAPDPARLQRCHLDYNPENVHRTTAGTPLVLDWENAGPGDPRQELAATLVEFGPASELAAGYAAAGGAAAGLVAGDCSLGLAVHAHLIEHYAGVWLAAPPGSDERPRVGRWLRELLPPLFTRSSIDELLAAVQQGLDHLASADARP